MTSQGASPFSPGGVNPVPDPPDRTAPGPDEPTNPEDPEHPEYDGGTTYGFVSVQFFVAPGSQQTTTVNPQKPPTLKNVTQGQQNRFNEAFNELLRRLQENNGDNPCAKFFGGLKNALDELKKTKFSVGSTVDPRAFAETNGKKVTLNPNNGFFDTSGSFSMQVGVTFSPPGPGEAGRIPYLPVSISLGNVEAAAFALLHELGHRTGKLDPDDDSTGISSVLNSGKIREACFGETLTK